MNDDPSTWSPGPFTQEANKTEKGNSSRGGVFGPERRWPDPLSPQAFYGLAGDIVRAIEPHTEADPAALLGQFLVAFGNASGGTSHFTVEATRHACNLFIALVGVTSKARKGSAWNRILQLMEQADPEWVSKRILSGLSSGEGLIWAVRDPIQKRYPRREKGRVVGHDAVDEDPGEPDKRLLVFESEFAGPLRAMNRDGSTLSAIARQAWDSGNLRTLTKNSPVHATEAHISMIAQTTRDDLLRYLNATEQGNGFGNRFLWFCVRRSKSLPEGGSVSAGEIEKLAKRIVEALDFARRVGEVHRDENAATIWRGIYPDLSRGKLGLFGAVTSRAEAQVMRIAMMYALLELSGLIRSEHLGAALAVWTYCSASAKYIFGDALGYPEADRILDALRANPAGLTRTEIQDLFGRHRSAHEIDAALAALAEHSLARWVSEGSNGRPVERWFAV